MFETFVEQISNTANFFANSHGFHGIIGIVVFLAVVLVLTRIPASVRSFRGFWFVEVIIALIVIYAITTLVGLSLDLFQLGGSGAELSAIVTVPSILASAYLFNRAMRLFIWQGILERSALVVPRIVWNVFDVLAFVAAIYAILAFVYDQPMTGFIVSSGVVVGVVGLAFQPILGDVIAGIGLTVERPFATGDWIALEDGVMGEVINVDWRATEIKTWNNTVHVVPNGKLASASIHNYDKPDGIYGYWFYVTVARTVPPALVRRLLLEAALKSDLVLDEPAPVIRAAESDIRPMRYLVFLHCENYRVNFAVTDQFMLNAWSLFTKAGFNFAASPQDIEVHRAGVHKASEMEAAMLLKEVALLDPLGDDERAKLANDGIHHVFHAGDTIITEGETGGSMFIILAGMVLVQRQLPDGRVLDLARLGTYDYFGEMSLLTGEPRSASVSAHTECQILEIAKHSFEPLLRRRPVLTDQIAAIMAERKLKSELMTAETKKVSVGDRLRDYSEAFANSIRSFFGG